MNVNNTSFASFANNNDFNYTHKWNDLWSAFHNFNRNLMGLASIQTFEAAKAREDNNRFDRQIRKESVKRPQKKVNNRRYCGFCKTNGETPSVFYSHEIRDPITGKTVCPTLRRHTCEICCATGDDAHTRSHCPMAAHIRGDSFLNSFDGNNASYAHNIVSLKRSKFNGAGRVRRN